MLALILAAGNGTRMKSKIPKVLHKVNGKPMLTKVIETCKNFAEILLVLGKNKDLILNEYPDYNYITQEEQLGTGDAVKIAKDKIKNYDSVLIVYGDGPLLRTESLEKLTKKFYNDNLDCAMLSCKIDNPTGYGRIIRQGKKIVDIIEEKDTNDEQKSINEINVGVYIFKTSSLLQILDDIQNQNQNNEYYLTDAIRLLNKKNFITNSILLTDKNEMLGVNSKVDLAIVSNILRKRKLDFLMKKGVIIIDPSNTYIEEDVEIGEDSIIYPNTIISGKTKIGKNTIIYSSRIIDSIISDDCVIDNSVIEYSEIYNNVTIGPFSHLRKGTILKENVHIGNFVEIKNSIINENVKAGHLTYLGDTDIDQNTNIGAGSITCNYDGKNKHRTKIGNSCFIGSNTIMVAPIEIGNNVLTAAGSVITKNIDDNKIAFGRAKQVILDKK